MGSLHPPKPIGRSAKVQAQRPARFLVVIDSATAGGRVARLFLDNLEAVSQLDAGAPEVQLLTEDLAANRTALRPEWNRALAGHSRRERAAAEIYRLGD